MSICAHVKSLLRHAKGDGDTGLSTYKAVNRVVTAIVSAAHHGFEMRTKLTKSTLLIKNRSIKCYLQHNCTLYTIQLKDKIIYIVLFLISS